MYARVTQLVEYLPSKQDVASSSLVSRSIDREAASSRSLKKFQKRNENDVWQIRMMYAKAENSGNGMK